MLYRKDTRKNDSKMNMIKQTNCNARIVIMEYFMFARRNVAMALDLLHTQRCCIYKLAEMCISSAKCANNLELFTWLKTNTK